MRAFPIRRYAATVDGGTLRDGILAMKATSPAEFAAHYGWIDFSDGIDEREAGCLAQLYFNSSGWLCGGIGRVKKIGRYWECEFLWGYAGVPINPICVDSRSGAIWQRGNERIEDLKDIVGIQSQNRPNQSLEPTATAVTPRADARVAPAAAVAHH